LLLLLLLLLQCLASAHGDVKAAQVIGPFEDRD